MIKEHHRGTRVKTAVLTQTREQTPEPAPDDDLYAVAMLKVAMELKKGQQRGFEDIFEETLKVLNVDRESFKKYLSRHMEKLMKTAQKRGY